MTTNPPDQPMPANKPTKAEISRLIALMNDDDTSFEEKTAAFKQLFEWGYGPGTPPVHTDGAYRKG